jgi:PhnB protein
MADQVPPGWRSKIMHARLSVGDDVLMGSDARSDRYEPMKGLTVTLRIDDPRDVERVFHALSENARVRARCRPVPASRRARVSEPAARMAPGSGAV